MNEQPKALRVANLLDEYCHGDFYQKVTEAAADELRRLHSLNQESVEALKKANEQTEHFERLWYLRGDLIEELVEALEEIASETYDEWTNGAKAQRIAEAALSKMDKHK